MPESADNWLGLDGASVVIAGAGGIGTATAIGYAENGARILIVDNDADRVDVATAEVLAAVPGAPVTGLQADLTEVGSGASVVRHAVDNIGGVDVLLHAVGINDRRPVLEFTAEEWDRVIRVNMGTAFELAQAAGRHMVERGRGRIVMISSVSGLLAHTNHGPYAVSKGGVNQLVRVMAREWAPHGITVNAIAPGYIETNLTAAHLAQPGVREGLVELVPAGRLGTPAEVVGPILFLSSAHSGFVTGHIMYVDGGRTLV
jgi:gluconate 5-dehydrogenase